jgi:signal transduction histidine kinase
VAIVAGLLVFAVLTRPLQRLVAAVRVYREGSFRGRMSLSSRQPPRDEIDELGQAIVDMSERIEHQFGTLQQVDNTRRELIANVSHDLRTPLSSMQGYLETIMVKTDLSEAERQNYLQIAYKHSRRLNQLVGELFELAKLESDTVEPDWEQFRLMELVHDLAQDYELQATERGVSIVLECEDVDISVYADIGLIHRVLENLLENALRHVDRQGEIHLRVSGDEHKVWIEVADNGDGIASHEIPHIFDRFYRPASEEPQSGHGLGLAIVKRIVELHQSQVQVSSEIDKGTAFSFWLPYSPLPT